MKILKQVGDFIVEKVKIEFINTCPNCDAYGKILKELADKHAGEVELTFYYAGKDMDYIPKYGMITRGTMIVNEKDKYEEGFINKRIIYDIVEKALEQARDEA